MMQFFLNNWKKFILIMKIKWKCMKTEINNIHQRVIFVVVLWQSQSLTLTVVNQYFCCQLRVFLVKIYRHPELSQKRTFSTCHGSNLVHCRPYRDLWWQVFTGLNNFLEPLHINITCFRSQQFPSLRVYYGHWLKLHVNTNWRKKQTFDRLSPATEIIVLENTYKITRKGHVSIANVIGNC